MPRGRKKDLTIPPTRSLVQQRDYRARRALYVANLEERCRRAEEENTRLREELNEVRGRLVNPVLLLPETVSNTVAWIYFVQSPDLSWLRKVAASTELMLHLSSAREALTKFNRLIFPDALGSTHHAMQSHSPAYQPLMPSTSTSPNLQSRNDTNSRRKELYVDNSLPPYVSQPSSDSIIPPSESAVSECCGGIVDCSDLCDDDEEPKSMLCKTSEIRSTTSIDWWSMLISMFLHRESMYLYSYYTVELSIKMGIWEISESVRGFKRMPNQFVI